MIRSLLAASTTALFFALTGCAAEESTEDGVTTQEESDLTASCGARYGEALEHYKTAVAWSKERLASGTCEWENGYLWQIADEASRAVMTCDAFRKTIKTSPWAEPLRRALSPSLNLRSYTGELLVIRDSQFQNWTGVEGYLSGTSFWARAEGAFGPAVRIDFYAEGQATFGHLVFDDGTGNVDWQSDDATYTVESINGSASGKRILRITRGTLINEYELGVENPASYNDAPLFKLSPLDAHGTPLYSLVSECDA